MVIRTLAFTLTVIASSTALADLIVRDLVDHPNSSLNGAGVLTYDTETNLEWLDWTSTQDLSASSVAQNLLPGGQYDGFRYATRAELETFFEHMWGRDLTFGAFNMNLRSGEHAILKGYVGTTFPAAEQTNVLWGWHTWQNGTFTNGTIFPASRNRTTNARWGINRTDHNSGHALVRAVTAVPEPSSAASVFAALIAVIFRRRRGA